MKKRDTSRMSKPAAGTATAPIGDRTLEGLIASYNHSRVEKANGAEFSWPIASYVGKRLYAGDEGEAILADAIALGAEATPKISEASVRRTMAWALKKQGERG
jgi:hypothetical protein